MTTRTLAAAVLPTPVPKPGPTPVTSRARALIWPLLVGACVVGIVYADHGQVRNPARGGMALGMVVVVSVLEFWLPLSRRQNLRLDRHSARDVGHFALNIAAGILGAGAPLLLPWLLSAPVHSAGMHLIWPVEWPWFVQCLIAIAACDALGYAVHRLEHGVPAFWAYHVVHHDVPSLNILRGTREHFVTNLVRGVLVFGPLLCLGAPIEALAAYQTLVITQGSIAHGNLKLRFLPGLDRWLVTPPVHRLHHAADRSLSDSNFSAVSPIWDRLFGTFSDPAEHEPPAIGIEGDGVPDSFLGQVAHPFGYWARALRVRR